MNLSELQIETGRLLSDPENTRWPITTVTDRLNNAQTQILSDTNAIIVSEGLTPVLSQNTIHLNTSSTNIIDIIRMYVTNMDGNIFPLKFMLLEQVNYRFPNWQNWEDGQPRIAWLDHTNDFLYLAPAPDANNVIANGIKIHYVPIVNDMVNGTDNPFSLSGFYTENFSLVPYHMALVHYAVSFCWQDEGTPESIAKSQFQRSGNFQRPGQYEIQINKINEKLNAQQAADNNQILWQPQGGRVGAYGMPTKSYPFRT